MRRREFLIQAATAFPIVAGASYFMSCNSSPTSPQMVTAITVTSSVTNSHAHTVSVPVADLGAATDHDYNTSTYVGHFHMVTLTAAQLAAINGGGTVTVSSSTVEGHDHDFTIRK